MKNYFLVLLVILVSSCDPDINKFTLTVKNSSSKPVRFKAIRQYQPNSAPNIINLNAGEELSKFFADRGPGTHYNFQEFFEGDKLTIIYNNDKYITFIFGTFEGNSNNPFNLAIYNGREQVYVVKDEYFANAIPCDANCD